MLSHRQQRRGARRNGRMRQTDSSSPIAGLVPILAGLRGRVSFDCSAVEKTYSTRSTSIALDSKVQLMDRWRRGPTLSFLEATTRQYTARREAGRISDGQGSYLLRHLNDGRMVSNRPRSAAVHALCTCDGLAELSE